MALSLIPLIAYIDPATGAIILQVLLAGLLGASIVFKRAFLFPVSLARKLFGKSTASVDVSHKPDELN